MYVTEAMIQSMEEMMRNAADMEKSIKAMMETEGRMHGLELDRRHSARDMWAQLSGHMVSHAPTASMMTEVAMPAVDPMMHTHDDGMQHSHEGGDMEHSHDDGAPSSVEPPMDSAPMPSPANHQDQMSDPEEPKV
tara:strand:- start:151 stop:555 length:405 start_codon:yes stop_codon:yes gene_type:complete